MFQVVCTAGKINVTMEFAKHKHAKMFAYGFKKGIKAWDVYQEFDLKIYSHRGYRFGQLLAFYCFRHQISMQNIRVFVEVTGSGEL